MEYNYENLKDQIHTLLQNISPESEYPNRGALMFATDMLSLGPRQFSLKILEECAENDLVIQCLLCHFYLENDDYEKAVKWLQAAAKRGSSEAQVSLSRCLIAGKGNEKDATEAIFWLNRARLSFNFEAMYLLAECYKRGVGVSPNISMAAHHFQEFEKYKNQEPRNKTLNFKDNEAIEIKNLLDKFAFFIDQGRFEGDNFSEKALNALNELVDFMQERKFTFLGLQNYLIDNLGNELNDEIKDKVSGVRFQVRRSNYFEGKEDLFDK